MNDSGIGPPRQGKSFWGHLLSQLVGWRRKPSVPESDPRADTHDPAQSHLTATQFRETPSEDVLDVVIGLDFGTSCTKVVIQTPCLAGERALAIPFDGWGHPDLGYLLPNRLILHDDGLLSVDQDPGQACRVRQDLTVRLYAAANNMGQWHAQSDELLQAVALASGYLSLVIRQSRHWFLRTQREALGRFRLRWHLNIGIPSAGYEDEDVKKAFRSTAAAAWLLSTYDGRIDLSQAIAAAEMALNGGKSPRHQEPEVMIGVIPEVAAEVVGYARSPLRDAGLHVLVDVGASTLDICSFILHQNEIREDQYSLLTAEVCSLGVLELHSWRVDAIEKRYSLRSRVPNPPLDPLAPIPEDVSDYVDDVGEDTIQELEKLDDKFELECTNGLMRTIMDLKIRRDPNSRRWKDGLPVFICGGGRELSHILNAVNTADERLTMATYAAGLEKRTLPIPTQLANQDLGEEAYQRLAVAFGLSFPRINIGRIEPPSKLPDIDPPPERDPYKDFPDKDIE